MSPWQQFKEAVVDRQLRLFRREYDWAFDFGDNLSVNVETLWRLRNKSGIVCISYDDGHRFGLQAPQDAESVANDLLNDAAIVTVEDGEVMPDFTIQLSNGLAVDVIARSAGYESWQASFGEATIVGRNDG